MLSQSSAKLLIFSIVYFLTGPHALADVLVSNLKKGSAVQFTKPTKIFQYTWMPTGAGLAEPGLRLVDVQYGTTFLVDSVAVRDWTKTRYRFFSEARREFTITLKALEQAKDIEGTFKIVIDTAPSVTDLNLDYLTVIE